jgi:GntR family transcriptional regulator
MIEAIQARLAAAPSRPGPKYQTLRDAIMGAISGGDWMPGMRLPTEAELARILPYSLGTIQKAYGELVRDGLVERARGRGSFVAPLRQQMAEPWHCRYLADDGAVLPIYPRLLGHEPAADDPRWTQLFGADASVTRIDRAISINNEFEVLSRFFAPRPIAKALLRMPRARFATANFKAVLLRELNMPIRRITQTIATADRRRWRDLGITSKAHLQMEATAYSSQGDVVYFQEFYIPPNSRRLLFDSELRY